MGFLCMLSYSLIYTRVTMIATLSQGGRSHWAAGRIGNQMSMYISLRVLWKYVIRAGLVFFFPAFKLPSRNPEKEEVTSHSCFLLPAKKSTSLFPRAHFPSRLGSSECIVSQYKDLEGGMLSRAHLLYPCFPLCEIVPPSCSPQPGLSFCSHDGCVYSGCSTLGHTGKLRGVSKFTCPAFQANVFDIEQWNDSARFRSVRLECN